MTSSLPLPSELVSRISRVLNDHGVTDFAFTGGVAVGVWAVPRQTRDVDVCGVLPLEEVDRLLATRDGIRSGSGELPALVRFRVEDWDVDLFVARDAHDRECLSRAIQVDLEGLKLRVVTPEDLLIHKLIKLRSDRRRIIQDVADIRAVIAMRGEDLDWTYLRRWLPSHEASLLESIEHADDEELVRRLLQV